MISRIKVKITWLAILHEYFTQKEKLQEEIVSNKWIRMTPLRASVIRYVYL